MGTKKEHKNDETKGCVAIYALIFFVVLAGFAAYYGAYDALFWLGIAIVISFFVLRRVLKKEAISRSLTRSANRSLDPSQRHAKASYSPGEDLYEVTDVIDGDTIRTRLWNIRLIGIDAPETVHPSRSVERFGKVASAMTRELLLGNYVRLETDASQGNSDNYGRLLAYVWLEDGTLVNEWLVRNGYAREQVYYNKPCKYRGRLLAAQREARQTRRGMWAN